MSGGSMKTKGHGFGFERDDIVWFSTQWVPDRVLAIQLTRHN
jgi:hypothetical protein